MSSFVVIFTSLFIALKAQSSCPTQPQTDACAGKTTNTICCLNLNDRISQYDNVCFADCNDATPCGACCDSLSNTCGAGTCVLGSGDDGYCCNDECAIDGSSCTTPSQNTGECQVASTEFECNTCTECYSLFSGISCSTANDCGNLPGSVCKDVDANTTPCKVCQCTGCLVSGDGCGVNHVCNEDAVGSACGTCGPDPCALGDPCDGGQGECTASSVGGSNECTQCYSLYTGHISCVTDLHCGNLPGSVCEDVDTNTTPCKVCRCTGECTPDSECNLDAGGAGVCIDKGDLCNECQSCSPGCLVSGDGCGVNHVCNEETAGSVCGTCAQDCSAACVEEEVCDLDVGEGVCTAGAAGECNYCATVANPCPGACTSSPCLDEADKHGVCDTTSDPCNTCVACVETTAGGCSDDADCEGEHVTCKRDGLQSQICGTCTVTDPCPNDCVYDELSPNICGDGPYGECTRGPNVGDCNVCSSCGECSLSESANDCLDGESCVSSTASGNYAACGTCCPVCMSAGDSCLVNDVSGTCAQGNNNVCDWTCDTTTTDPCEDKTCTAPCHYVDDNNVQNTGVCGTDSNDCAVCVAGSTCIDECEANTFCRDASNDAITGPCVSENDCLKCGSCECSDVGAVCGDGGICTAVDGSCSICETTSDCNECDTEGADCRTSDAVSNYYDGTCVYDEVIECNVCEEDETTTCDECSDNMPCDDDDDVCKEAEDGCLECFETGSYCDAADDANSITEAWKTITELVGAENLNEVSICKFCFCAGAKTAKQCYNQFEIRSLTGDANAFFTPLFYKICAISEITNLKNGADGQCALADIRVRGGIACGCSALYCNTNTDITECATDDDCVNGECNKVACEEQITVTLSGDPNCKGVCVGEEVVHQAGGVNTYNVMVGVVVVMALLSWM